MAAAFSVVLIGLLVVVPATWFAQKIAEQAISVPENIQKQIAAGKWHIDGGEHPLMAHLLARIEQQVGSPENASMAMAWLKTVLSRLIKESAAAVVEVSLMLYFLCSIFCAIDFQVLKAIRSFLPLSESETDTLFSRVNDTIHATLCNGMLTLWGLQGLLGGLMFWWLGVPSPWFWALVAAVFAFVPVVDTFCPLAPGSSVSRIGRQVGTSSRGWLRSSVSWSVWSRIFFIRC